MTLLSKEIDWLPGRHDRVPLKDHPQLARFGGDGRVHGRAKIQRQPGRVACVQLETDLDADIADEQPARAFVKINRRSQKARQQCAQRAQRNQSARVFDQERSRQIEIASTNPGPRLSRNKLGIDRVIAKVPAPSVRLGAYAAERFQKFEQADILMARTLQDRKRVDRDRRVDGDVLFVRSEAPRTEASRWPTVRQYRSSCSTQSAQLSRSRTGY